MADAKLSALTALTGATVDIANDLLLIDDVSVTTNKKITVDELGIALGLFNVVTGTRDVSLSSSQAITGATFKPRAMIGLMTINGTSSTSVCLSSGTTAQGFADDNQDNAGTYAVLGGFLQAITGAGANNFATIASLDSDGCTLNWTKTGSPTGTANWVILFMR